MGLSLKWLLLALGCRVLEGIRRDSIGISPLKTYFTTKNGASNEKNMESEIEVALQRLITASEN